MCALHPVHSIALFPWQCLQYSVEIGACGCKQHTTNKMAWLWAVLENTVKVNTFMKTKAWDPLICEMCLE